MVGIKSWISDLFHAKESEHEDDIKQRPKSKSTSARSSRRISSATAPSTNNNKPIEDADHWWCFKGHQNPKVPVFDAVDDDRVTREIIKKIRTGQLPLIEIPENIMRTLKILDDPNFHFKEVADLVEKSPAMAGEFLKVINSSLISHGTTIKDLQTALPRLGKTKVKSMLYMYSAKMNFSTNSLFQDLAVDIVEHCYAVGLIASYLSQRYYTQPDTAFFAGLLHDIGKLAILKSITDAYDLPKKIEFRVTEEVFAKIFPGLHERAGLYIVKHWGTDEIVEASVLHHHDLMIDTREYQYPERVENLVSLINISDTMARMLGKGRVLGPTNIFNEPSAKHLNINKDRGTIDFLDKIPPMMDFKLDR